MATHERTSANPFKSVPPAAPPSRYGRRLHSVANKPRDGRTGKEGKRREEQRDSGNDAEENAHFQNSPFSDPSGSSESLGDPASPSPKEINPFDDPKYEVTDSSLRDPGKVNPFKDSLYELTDSSVDSEDEPSSVFPRSSLKTHDLRGTGSTMPSTTDGSTTMTLAQFLAESSNEDTGSRRGDSSQTRLQKSFVGG